MNSKLKVLYVNARCYDYLTAAIIEGLNELSLRQPIELWVTSKANYATRRQVVSRQDAIQKKESFDVFILGTNFGSDPEFFWDIADPERSVCIDGADESEFVYDPGDFAIYFKRELLTEAVPANVLPCPFAVERRWLQPLCEKPRYALSACFGPRAGERRETLEFLTNLRRSDCWLGEVKGGWSSYCMGIFKGQTTFRTARWLPFGVGHNKQYYRVLNKSAASLSVAGGGVDTARYWEILGSGAVLISKKSQLRFVDPLVPGEHMFEYADLAELPELIAICSRHDKTVSEMRASTRQYVLCKHTTQARANYVVTTITNRLRINSAAQAAC